MSVTSRCTARWPLWRAALSDSYRQISQSRSISAGEKYSTMSKMGRWSLWSSFDVNRSTFDEDEYAKNDFYIFVLSDLDLWHLYVKLAPLVTFVQRYVSTNWKFLGLSYSIWGKSEAQDGQTDGQTDGGNS